MLSFKKKKKNQPLKWTAVHLLLRQQLLVNWNRRPPLSWLALKKLLGNWNQVGKEEEKLGWKMKEKCGNEFPPSLKEFLLSLILRFVPTSLYSSVHILEMGEEKKWRRASVYFVSLDEKAKTRALATIEIKKSADLGKLDAVIPRPVFWSVWRSRSVS